ncbi:unnamed protein product [Schistosoma curassoni]|uniref:G_PROTEIN_RECEP_F1_2 domain-containing protein n=1 Tax=Schistosoma curassoni TaxID=6186 RepID=A0A183JV11_9TREM|nr:unnamed protein product [Schistosoma curassoni]
MDSPHFYDFQNISFNHKQSRLPMLNFYLFAFFFFISCLVQIVFGLSIFFLVNSFSEVLPTFGVYLRKVCEDAPHLIHFVTYYNSLRAIIPIIDVVIASLPCMDAMCCYLSDPHILPSLIHIACGCQKQKSELPLVRGILADLNVLYKDIIKSISSCLEVR